MPNDIHIIKLLFMFLPQNNLLKMWAIFNNQGTEIASVTVTNIFNLEVRSEVSVFLLCESSPY